MNRPTITLCCIMKDEMAHIKGLLSSVSGCFDEVWLTDTGSTDGTLEFAKSEEASALAGCPVRVKTFTWIDDFAAARNFSMEGVKTDYVMWLDLDDRLNDKEKFIRWRDDVMQLADFWIAPYRYAFDDNGTAIINFARERVIKTARKFSWKYFIHEGMIAEEPVAAQFVNHWVVDHRRTKEDYDKDFSRNVSLLERKAKEGELPVRLKWYYGKELFDKQRFAEAYVWLDQVIDHKELERHDRILAFEYLVRASIHRWHIEEEHKGPQRNDMILAKALSLAMQAVCLDPQRAEFYCLAGDCLVKMGRINEAMPFYTAATGCQKPSPTGANFLYVTHAAYQHMPMDAIARIKFNMGDLDGAIEVARDSLKKYENHETSELLKQLLNMKGSIESFNRPNKVETDQIVFTCMPGSHPYPFDEEIYKKEGIGGSETALVEVAKWVRKITGRNVIVFNDRESEKTCESGVEYRPSKGMAEYFGRYLPEAHISWRHNVKLTSAKTYLWCHDLFTPGAEFHQNYLKHICLSNFHKNFVLVQQGMPDSKIVISRNGIETSRFEETVDKDDNKIIFPSSPDRGLEFAIDIVEKARAKSGRPLELHVYYGIEHLPKYGPQMQALHDKLKALFEEKSHFVKYHGKTEQKLLAKEMMQAVCWLYPANFIESYCITAIESIYAKCYPLVREIGALKDTLKPFVERDMAKLLFLDPFTDEQRSLWADELIKVLDEKRWLKIDPDQFDYSWRGVAEEFIELFELKTKKQTERKALEGASADITA